MFIIKSIIENGFELRDNDDEKYYYGKGELDSFGEIMVWSDDDGETWKWLKVRDDLPSTEVFDGELKVKGLSEAEIEAWVKSI